MKKKFLLGVLLSTILCIGMLIIVHPVTAQSPAININEIEEGRHIKGRVSGLTNPQNYKVIVYVRTNIWYIHPFEGPGEGLSWAAIDKDGNWSIKTEKRSNIANSIAALVVDLNVAEKAPNSLDNIEKITPRHAMITYTTQQMKEKRWYGKL